MISRRLTKNEKAEILEAYKAGGHANALAEKYSCTANTINRTVKTLLSESEYTLLKKKRSKVSKKQGKIVDNQKGKKDDLKYSNSLTSLKDKSNEENLTIKLNEEIPNSEVGNIAALALEDADDFDEDLSFDNNNNIDNNF